MNVRTQPKGWLIRFLSLRGSGLLLCPLGSVLMNTAQHMLANEVQSLSGGPEHSAQFSHREPHTSPKRKDRHEIGSSRRSLLQYSPSLETKLHLQIRAIAAQLIEKCYKQIPMSPSKNNMKCPPNTLIAKCL